MLDSLSDLYAMEQGIIDRRISTYNQQLREFFSSYQKYFDMFNDWKEEICLYHAIKLVFANDGTAPASNVDVELYFPDEVVPVDEDDVPEKPKPPAAPIYEEGLTIPDVRGLGNFDVTRSLMEHHKRLTAHLSGVSDIELEENAIYISYSELKHGFNKISDSLIFRFASIDAVGSFNIDYRLSANELPHAVEGKLNIRIDDIQQ